MTHEEQGKALMDKMAKAIEQYPDAEFFEFDADGNCVPVIVNVTITEID